MRRAIEWLTAMLAALLACALIAVAIIPAVLVGLFAESRTPSKVSRK